MKELTYEDLADFYKEKTGNSAFIRSMDSVYDWATKQEEIITHKDSSLSFKNEVKK